MSDSPKLKVAAPMDGAAADIVTPEALSFLAGIVGKFSARRDQLLDARAERADRMSKGEQLDFDPATREIREGDWSVQPPPPGLTDRRVEVTAPASPKMIVRALNSKAKVFMADFEDSLCPTWVNLMAGHEALLGVAQGSYTFEDPGSGKIYELAKQRAELVVRPRGWHLPEKNILHNGAPISATLADFALFFFHCASALHASGKGPYLYVPKVEHYREAELWEDVISHAEEKLGIPHGATKVTLLIETLPSVFQMHEILHALRGRIVGLNCGRWDYIFSYIKTLRDRKDCIVPDRNQVTMAMPFLKAYSRLLVQTCHRRNAHAMGGMSAFFPIQGDEAATRLGIGKVCEDKRREIENGHDGTWVAHPKLIDSVMEIFEEKVSGVDQKSFFPEGDYGAGDLLAVPKGDITVAGVDNNIQVTLRYISAWLSGSGAVSIFNLMEDAATAEISRVQLWQWAHYGASISGGGVVDKEFLGARIADVAETIHKEGVVLSEDHLAAARDLLEQHVFSSELSDFIVSDMYSMVS